MIPPLRALKRAGKVNPIEMAYFDLHATVILLEACFLAIIGSLAHYFVHKEPPQTDLVRELVIGFIAGFIAFCFLSEATSVTVPLYIFAGYTASSFIKNVMNSMGGQWDEIINGSKKSKETKMVEQPKKKKTKVELSKETKDTG